MRLPVQISHSGHGGFGSTLGALCTRCGKSEHVLAAQCELGGFCRRGALALLVLDDYHKLTTLAIHDFLARTLDQLPPHLHLVVASRADPPLPLARLRARSQLVELRAAELRFDTDETAAFLRETMTLSVSNAAASALEARTEGWAAALQLAALALRDTNDQAEAVASITGSNRYLVDYLAEEVLNRLPTPYVDPEVIIPYYKGSAAGIQKLGRLPDLDARITYKPFNFELG